mmetsp:Transcript_110723/g.191931  ORF Transcript_110723/g.191931 Transcript_110723/m.191931 type:complete len:92 (-) Transcript_110723:553-828(-)
MRQSGCLNPGPSGQLPNTPQQTCVVPRHPTHLPEKMLGIQVLQPAEGHGRHTLDLIPPKHTTRRASSEPKTGLSFHLPPFDVGPDYREPVP